LIKNKKSYSYGYTKTSSQPFIKLMKMTGIQNVYAEIICAKNNSSLCREMENNNGRYGLYRGQSDDIYTDYLWVNCLTKCDENLLDKVIESEPEIVTFYFSEKSIIDDRDNLEIFAYTKNMDEFIWECVFEIGLDEDYFSVSFNSRRFSPKKFISEIENVICAIYG